ncbi:MAG TPA: ABC transporter permease [Thermoanaerobaculia bacterium]
MVNLLRDIRFGFRMLSKNAGLTLIAVLTLGLGIGLTAVMFSIVKGVVLSKLPFDHADRILFVGTRYLDRNEATTTVALHDYLDWKSRQGSFESLEAFQQSTFNLSSGGGGAPERVRGAYMSPGALSMLHVKPLLGRLFSPGEDAPGAPRVVVLGERIWRSHFGNDPQAIGKTIRVNGQPASIVGVMPAGFLFPVHEEIWAPLQLNPNLKRGTGPQLDVIGRLREGVSQSAAQAELAALARAVEQQYPDTNKGVTARVGPYTEKYVNAQAAALLFVMLGVVGLVLLLACANVASLLMARASVRTKELAIRSVLGAGRRGVIIQILIESLILALIGATLGLLVTGAGIKLFNASIADANPPFWFNTSIDPLSLLFVLAISALAGVTSGLVPALQSSKINVNQILKDEGRGSTGLRIGRFTRGIVIFEVALSCALLVGAGLMIKSIVNVRNMNLGFDKKGLLTASLTLDESTYPQPADRARFVDQLLRGLSGRTGVASAAVADFLPTEPARVDVYALEGRVYNEEKDKPRVHKAIASPGLFKTLGTQVEAGRDFGAEDRADSLPVVIVNQSFARRAWPNESPLGRRIRLGKAEKGVWRTVIGVAPDLRMNGFDTTDRPDGVYVPLTQEPPATLRLAVRATGDPLALTQPVREQVAAINRDLPLDAVQSMVEVVSKNTYAFNLFGALFSLFGLAALILASVGIYGVIAFAVQQRTREVGIRMALGAQRRDVLSLLLGQGFRQLAFGLVAGLFLAWGISRLIASFLFQVSPGDLGVFVGVALALSAVALAACFVPAQRATQVDPQVAIRYE